MSFKWKPLFHNTRSLVPIWAERFSIPQASTTPPPNLLKFFSTTINCCGLRKNILLHKTIKGTPKKSYTSTTAQNMISTNSERTQAVKEPSWKHQELHPSCIVFAGFTCIACCTFWLLWLIYFLIQVRNLKRSQSCQHPLLERVPKNPISISMEADASRMLPPPYS